MILVFRDDMHLQVKSDECVGCSLCVYWCSVRHCGLSSWSHSRIRIAWDHNQMQPTPQVCQQCSDPACVEMCPQKALRKEQEGYIHVDTDACTGCRTCEAACPLGGVHADKAGKVLLCDLCGGHPLCADVCPVHLIEVVW